MLSPKLHIVKGDFAILCVLIQVFCLLSRLCLAYIHFLMNIALSIA